MTNRLKVFVLMALLSLAAVAGAPAIAKADDVCGKTCCPVALGDGGPIVCCDAQGNCT